MQSSSPSSNTSDSTKHRWAGVLGSTVAVLTLTVPLFTIAYYSSPNSIDSLSGNIYTMPKK